MIVIFFILIYFIGYKITFGEVAILSHQALFNYSGYYGYICDDGLESISTQ